MSDNYTGADNLEVMLEAENYNNYLKDLVRSQVDNPESVLDFGAGIGTFTDALIIPPETVHCVEPDNAAQQRLKQRGYNVYSAIEETDQQFDYIFSLNVLEHIEEDDKAAALLFDRLKPGGKLFVYVPAFNHIRTSMDDLVGHHRRYTRTSLATLIHDAGFKIEKTAYTDFLGYFATLLFRAMDALKSNPAGTINRNMLLLYDRAFFPLSKLLSLVFAKIVGKNVYIVATRPG